MESCILSKGLPWWVSGKESAFQCRRHEFDPWFTKVPWRRKWQTTPVLLPGKSHGQRSLVGYSPWGHKELDTTERLYFHFTSLKFSRGQFEDIILRITLLKEQGLIRVPREKNLGSNLEDSKLSQKKSLQRSGQ